LDVDYSLTDSVREEGQASGVAADVVTSLHHSRGALRDGVQQFPFPQMSVNSATDCIAGGHVFESGEAHSATLHGKQQWCTLHHREWFPNGKAKLCVESQ
jgi:hypothetical protein